MSSDVSQQTAAVLHQHLTAIAQGDLSAILSDYTEDAVLFLPDNTLHGREAIGGFFAHLLATLPADWIAGFQLHRQDVHGEVAYIFWQAPPALPLGTDTFVIRNGKIVAQTFALLAPASGSS
jgi:ketosteroid isomerase-like protein